MLVRKNTVLGRVAASMLAATWRRSRNSVGIFSRGATIPPHTPSKPDPYTPEKRVRQYGAPHCFIWLMRQVLCRRTHLSMTRASTIGMAEMPSTRVDGLGRRSSTPMLLRYTQATPPLTFRGLSDTMGRPPAETIQD